MVTTRGQRLRAARKIKFRSARAAALDLKIPIATYGAHERAQLPGGRDFGPEEAKRYAQRFGVTTEWLLLGPRRAHFETPFEPEQPGETAPLRTSVMTPVRVPVVGYVGAGLEAHFYDLSHGSIYFEIEEPLFDRNPTIIDVHDHGLGSQFDNWLVFFHEIHKPVTSDLVGHFCVVGMADGQVVLRQLERGRTAKCYDLLSEFGTDFRDVAVSWAAKVKIIVPS